jgi:hypothetical protein
MDNNFPCPHTESTLDAVTFFRCTTTSNGRNKGNKEAGQGLFFSRGQLPAVFHCEDEGGEKVKDAIASPVNGLPHTVCFYGMY